MEFEEWVKIENRYQDALNSTTEPEQNVFFELNSYKEKRDAYYCRLKEEKEKFNSAVAQIKHSRLLEHKNFKACIIWSIITIAFMVCIDFGIPIGFKNFFAMSGVGKIPFIISIIVSVSIEIAFFLNVYIYDENNNNSYGIGEVFSVIIAFVIIGVPLFVVLFLAVRLLIVLIGYLSLWIDKYAILAVCVASVIILLCYKSTFKSNKFKILFYLNLMVLLFITAGCYLY